MMKSVVITTSNTKMLLRTARAAMLLTAMLAAGAAAGAALEAETGSPPCSAVEAHLSVASRRNVSGHVQTSLTLTQSARLPAPPASTLLDVRTASARCGGVRTDTLSVTLEGPPPPPSPGYKDFQGIGYYRVHVEHLTWEQAKKTCEDEDAHLLIINSDAEAEVIRQAIKSYTNASSYISIGAHDKDIEGHYVTIFGDTLAAAGYERWHPGQPSHGNDQNCLTVYTPSMGLHDAPCGGKISFICEQVVA